MFIFLFESYRHQVTIYRVKYQNQQYSLSRTALTVKRNGGRLQQGRTVQLMPANVLNLRNLCITAQLMDISTRYQKSVHMKNSQCSVGLRCDMLFIILKNYTFRPCHPPPEIMLLITILNFKEHGHNLSENLVIVTYCLQCCIKDKYAVFIERFQRKKWLYFFIKLHKLKTFCKLYNSTRTQ